MFNKCKINNAGFPKYIEVITSPTNPIAKPLLKEIQDGSLLDKIQINALNNNIYNNSNNRYNNNNNNNIKSKIDLFKIDNSIIESTLINPTNSTIKSFTKQFKDSKLNQNLLYSKYPIKKLIFSEDDKIEIHKIETFLDEKQLDKAIEYYHESLLKEDSDINFRGFSMILYYLLNKTSTSTTSVSTNSTSTTSVSLTIEYFKYYINQHYINWLDSIDFIEFLNNCYEKSPESINQIYQILNQLELLDIKRTFIFCIFYLQLNLQDEAIKIINNNFKLIQQENQQNQQNQQKDQIVVEYRFLNDYWDYNLNNKLLFRNKPVSKRDVESLKYLGEIEAFNKLFSASGNHLKFYSNITQLFTKNGIITSKILVPSLLQFINSCLELNEIELLDQIMAPYKPSNLMGSASTSLSLKEQINLESIKPQICAILYYYSYFNSNNHNCQKINNIKNYLYNNVILNQIHDNSNSKYRFKEIFFDTLSLCSLEIGDYGEAIYFSDLKRIILETYGGELYNKSIGFKTDFYFPFIAFNEYHSKKELLDYSQFNNDKNNENKISIKYWKEKDNETFIKFNSNSSINNNDNSNNSNNSNSNNNIKYNNSLPVISNSSFLYRPLNIQEIINEGDKLILNRFKRMKVQNKKHPNSKYFFKMLLNLKNKYPKQLDDIQFIDNFKNYLVFINNQIFNNNQNNQNNNNHNNSNNININFNNSNNYNKFYKELPHSELFYSLVIRFKEYYENINKKKDLLVFISKLSPQLKNYVFNVNNEWYQLLYGKDYEGLLFMFNTLEESIYKSNDFYNFWLYKFSSNCNNSNGSLNEEYIQICWNLIDKMLKESIKIYKKPLSAFSSILFNSSIQLTNNQINLLNQIKLLNPWCEDSLELLLIKLKFYPTNSFNYYYQQEQQEYCRDEIIKVRNQLKSANIKTPDLIKLFVNLSSLAYPINQDFSNFQEWNSISIHSTDCIKSFVQSVCTILKNQNNINQLSIYINSERKVIGSMNFNTIKEILSSLSPIGQASFIQNNLRISTSYSKDFVDYIKYLNQLLPNENRSEFSILSSIISKEREISELETNNKLLKQSQFIKLFKTIYFK